VIEEWKKLEFIPGEYSWGSLHIYLPHGGLAELRREIVGFYEAVGLMAADWHSYLQSKSVSADIFDEAQFEAASKRMDKMFPGMRESLRVNVAGQLTEDEVLVMEESESVWIAVMSRKFEWTLPGLNPLALLLSKKYDVLATTLIENRYNELTLYRGGVAFAQHVSGPQAEACKKLVPTRAFDWNWFADKNPAIPPAELADEFDDLEKFINLAGPELMGLGHAFADAPLSDYDPKSFLVFRKEMPN
jgi:hypothetical protein